MRQSAISSSGLQLDTFQKAVLHFFLVCILRRLRKTLIFPSGSKNSRVKEAGLLDSWQSTVGPVRPAKGAPGNTSLNKRRIFLRYVQAPGKRGKRSGYQLLISFIRILLLLLLLLSLLLVPSVL